MDFRLVRVVWRELRRGDPARPSGPSPTTEDCRVQRTVRSLLRQVGDIYFGHNLRSFKYLILEDFLFRVFYSFRMFRYSASTFSDFFNHSLSVLWIRIRMRIDSDPHHFTDRDRHPGLDDPYLADPDRYHFQKHVFFYFFMKISTGFPKYVKS